MEHLEYPSRETWDQRGQWFAKEEEAAQHPMASYLVSEQACALTADVQAVFCAGAWASVMILAAAVIEAHLRETEPCGSTSSMNELIDAIGGDSDLHWLRRRRNALVHVNPLHPGLTTDQQWMDRKSLEEDAKRAVLLMFRVFYSDPAL